MKKAEHKTEWVDVTSWAARNQSGGKPTAWRLRTGGITLTVKLINNYFSLYCPEAGIYLEPLRGSYTLEHAQGSAVILVMQKLQKHIDALKAVS